MRRLDFDWQRVALVLVIGAIVLLVKWMLFPGMSRRVWRLFLAASVVIALIGDYLVRNRS